MNSGESNCGLLSDPGGLRHAEESETNEVATLPEVGATLIVSSVINAPSWGAPDASKNTAMTECASGFRYAMSEFGPPLQ